ncbi:disease resistance protein RPV1-like [Eucalyptus grandis]|uniref:disease resistance protein RPV1-like n=1 Tax=Eucalyptus grandis TaxID=71139 RepID=UPI00192EE6E2|nr:disease resistance protein RPV1-like [Eucalyptus grandis]
MKRDPVFGLFLAVLVASILLSLLAYYFVKSNKKSTRRKAEDTAASSSSATSASENYDVFLSFKGEDTRKTFVDHLYNGLIDAGIRVFRDDNELREGEVIGTNLLQAIKNSKISIPIISQNYASSKWCLQELVEMTECTKSIGHVVLPVFYRVKPAHVRYQIERFGKTFSHLSRKYLKEDVAKWKQALQEVASLKGWESEKTADGHEGELVKIVVRKVLSELKKAFQLVITEHLVGIDNAMEDILRLLDDKHNATQVIGIHGMGGIGKTTLAKAIYNKLFDQFQHHSFIADIRESSQSKGISYVQGQLKFDILKENDHVFNQDEGIRIMESRFKRKKVLILLDDVDDNNHIKALIGKRDWFEMGSKIIITTRIRSILDDVGVSYKYELKEIAKAESLILFSRHAFRRDSPPCEFESLSHAIVSTAGGLPLALEVIGSFLCGRNQAFWQDALKKLQIVPHEKVQEKLRISYDTLNYEEKQIFLDIAYFFGGYHFKCAFCMWDACNFFPKMGLETLSFMSLIKIGDNGMLKMHDQLRDLGREIIRQEDYHAFMNRSRLWLQEEALKIFQRTKVVKELKVLDLGGCLNLKVTPNLSAFRHLEVLVLKKCDNLEQIHPSIGEAKGLVVLDLQRCVKLRELPQEMGKLEELKVLRIRQTAIEEIPSCISSLKKLENLYANDCQSLAGIPDSVSHLVNLSILDLTNCLKLCRLPKSIGSLVNLQQLYLSRAQFSRNLHIPNSIGKLEWLTILDLSFLGICELPESIGDLKKLKRFSINYCKKLSSLPSTISKLGNLEEFNFIGCKSLGRRIHIDGLSSLKILRLSGTLIYGFHDGFNKLSRLEKLEELDATGCKNLREEILINGLSSLKILRLSGTSVFGFPDLFNKLSHLEKLEELDLCRGCKNLGGEILIDGECKNLEGEIPIDGLSSLKILRLSGTSVSGFPNLFNKLSHLEKLEQLDVSECKNLEGEILIDMLSSLRILRLGWTNISGFFNEFNKFSHLEKLEELDVRQCMNLGGEIPIDELSSLKILRLSGTSNFGFLDGFDKLSRMEKLEELDVTGCKNLRGEILIDRLSSLKILRLGWTSISGFSNEFNKLSHLEKLEELDVRQCMNLGGKIPIDGLSSLKILRLSGTSVFGFLDGFDKLSHLEKLEELDATGCKNLGGEILIDRLSSLRILRLGWTSISGFSNEFNKLSHLTKLEELDVRQCTNLGGEIPIDGLSSLKILRLSGTSISGFPDLFNKLSHLEKLEELDVRQCKNLEGEIPIDRLSSLKILRLSGTSVSGFPDLFNKLSRLEKLEELDATGCKNLGGKIFLDGLSSLRILRLGWTSISSFSKEFNKLSHLEKLEELDVRQCKNLEGEIL